MFCTRPQHGSVVSTDLMRACVVFGPMALIEQLPVRCRDERRVRKRSAVELTFGRGVKRVSPSDLSKHFVLLGGEPASRSF